MAAAATDATNIELDRTVVKLEPQLGPDPIKISALLNKTYPSHF